MFWRLTVRISFVWRLTVQVFFSYLTFNPIETLFVVVVVGLIVAVSSYFIIQLLCVIFRIYDSVFCYLFLSKRDKRISLNEFSIWVKIHVVYFQIGTSCSSDRVKGNFFWKVHFKFSYINKTLLFFNVCRRNVRTFDSCQSGTCFTDATLSFTASLQLSSFP